MANAIFLFDNQGDDGTVTFALPLPFQMGLAALWSVALGIIMGFTKRSAKEAA